MASLQANPSSLLVLLVLLNHILPSSIGGPLHREFLYPNFTASNLLYVDTSGTFLTSPNSSFHASICNPAKQQSRFYLCVRHKPTSTIVWAANRSAPISSSDILALSPSALSLSIGNSTVWSTPPLNGVVYALRLLDSGNLVLLDSSNATLWQSFDYPTDTIVSGQRLQSGSGHSLTSSVSDSDLSQGDYEMVVTGSDAVLQWKGMQQYWSTSGDVRVFRNSNAAVSYMEMNGTGLFFFSDGGYALMALLPEAELRIAKVHTAGQFVITSYVSANAAAVAGAFVAPEAYCDLPFFCKKLGLCTGGGSNNNVSACGCPDGFIQSTSSTGGCVPSDGSILPSIASCISNSSSEAWAVSYQRLPTGVEYFANKFASAAITGVNSSSSTCRMLCTSDCACLGFYHKNSTGWCFLLKDELGSLISATGVDSSVVGYIKVVSGSPSSRNGSSSHKAPALLPILLPLVATVLLLLLLLLLLPFCRERAKQGRLEKFASCTKESRPGDWRRKRWLREEELDEEVEDDGGISIPGLPTRFAYKELEAATEGFRNRIGSGGFGVVYKGVLPDKSVVAVKKLGSTGVHVKKEFCTEIAVIGKIHHVNLVNLRGFCTQGSRRLLVYEYMNRGSLDRSLFAAHGKPVMEWQERVDVALGAARGLAYLHRGCDHKIIHCDVKPENILLHDHNGVKISDFGLLKLISPDQSNLVTTLRGTRGYLAPEWLTNTAISDRTDVYSFGLVLLEIVRGRKNYASSTAADMLSDAQTTTWTGDTMSTRSTEASYFPLVAVEKHLENRYEELVDPRLTGRVTGAEVERVVKVALCCLHEEPGRRPNMALVVGMLEGTVPVWEPRLESLNFLKFYGGGIMEMEPPGIVMGATTLINREYSTNSKPVVGSGVYPPCSITASFSHLSSDQVSGPR